MKSFIVLQLFFLSNYIIISETLSKTEQYINKSITENHIFLPDATSNFKSNFLQTLLDKPEKINHTEKIALNAYDFVANKSYKSAEQLAPILFGQQLKEFTTNSLLPNDYITNKLNVNINKIVGNIESNVIRQYLSPILLSLEYLEKDEFFVDLQNTIEIIKILNNIDLLKNNYIPQKPNEYFNHISQQIELSTQLADKSIKFHNSEVLAIAVSLYLSLHQINELTLRNFDLYKQNIKTTIIETDLGKIALGGFDNDYYDDDYFMIIDLGGNDTYISNSQSLLNKMKSPISIIIDFSGDDIYIGNNYCFGSGIFGISILMDLDGNDSYSTVDFSLGSALYGVGIFFDKNGNDIYSSQNFSIGSAFYGWGIFVDKSGNDIYRGIKFTQGSAFGLAMGILTDVAGNDNYIASQPYSEKKDNFLEFHNYAQGASLGFPYSVSGGIGILLDLSGDDNYIANNSSQAYANFTSIASLIDKQGNDRYQSGNYSQSFSRNNSFAYLLDYDGNDTYTSNIHSQPYSQDLSLSILFDNYSINDYFVTKEYNQYDNLFSYYLKITNSQELDNSPKYSAKSFINNPFMLETTKMPIPFSDLYNIPSYIEEYKYALNQAYDLKQDLSNLFSQLVIYSNDSIRFNNLLDEFIKRNESIDFLEVKTFSNINSELLTISKIIPFYNPEYKYQINQLISEMLSNTNLKRRLLAIHLSAIMKLTENIPIINSLLDENDYSLRVTALWALAQLNYKNSNVYYSILENDKTLLRYYAAYAITKTDPTFFAEEKILSDPELSYSAYKGLREIESIDFETILTILESNSNEKFKQLIISLVNKSNISNKNAKNYKKRFRNLPDSYRMEIYNILIKAKNNAYNILSDKGNDPILKKIQKSISR